MLQLNAYFVQKPGDTTKSKEIKAEVEKVANSVPLLDIFPGIPEYQLVFVRYEHDADHVPVKGGMNRYSPGWTTGISDDKDFIEKTLAYVIFPPLKSIKVIRVGIPGNGFTLQDFLDQIPKLPEAWQGYSCKIFEGTIDPKFIGIIPVDQGKTQIEISPAFVSPPPTGPVLPYPPGF